MIEFLSMEVDGFCSIDHLSLDLNSSQIIWVKGANGFGKSTIISALAWGIYGRNLKGVSSVNTWGKNQPKDYKGTKVVINFRCSGKIHRIVRFQNYTEVYEGTKGGNRLLYYIEAALVEERSKNQIQSLIQENIGISYRLFLNTIIFGQGMKRMAEEGASDQKDIFEEMFDLSYISKAKNLVVEDLHDAEDDLNRVESEKRVVQSSMDEVKSHLNDLRDKNSSYQESINSQISDLKEKLASKKEKIRGVDFKELQYKLNQLKDGLNGLKKSKAELNKKILEVEDIEKTNISDFINNMYKLLTNKKVDEALRILIEYRDKMSNKYSYIHKVQVLDEKISESYDSIDRITNQLNSFTTAKAQVSDIREKIKGLKSSTPVDYQDLIKKQSNKLQGLKGRMKDIDLRLKEAQKMVDLYDWANKIPFGNRGIKAFLFSSSLDEINGYLETYSRVIGIYIQLYVDLSSLKKDFKILISMDGMEVEYDELSGGQKQLVNVTIAFAMNQTLANMRSINIAFLDEVFESLSQDNVEIVTNLINSIYSGKTLFLVSHQDSLPLANHRILQVDKVNGLSKYKFI